MRVLAKIFLWLSGGLVALIAVALVVLALFDWNLLRSTVSDRASAASGRTVAIAGDLDVDVWSWTPEITARDVAFGNAEWAANEDMVRIAEVYIKVRLAPLFLARVELEEMRLVKPEIWLERSEDGANWELAGDSAAEVALEASTPKEREDFPVLKHVDVEDAVIRFRDVALQDPLEVRLKSLAVEAGSFEDPVSLAAEGSYQGQAFSLQADGGSFEKLRDADVPYALALKARIGSTQLAVEGTLQEPVKLAGVDATIDLKGESLVELFDLLALPLPESPPYSLSGRLTRQGDRWALNGFEGRLGESDIGGDAAVETGGDRPRLVADLTSQSFRREDLEGFWGGGGAEGKKAAETQTAGKAGGDGHVLSDQPLSLPKLRRMDAEVRFKGKAVQSGTLRLEDITTELHLKDGLLTMTPLELGLAEGRIVADLRLDGREDVPEMAGDVTVEGLDINALMALVGKENAAAGQLRGRLKLAMRGRSLRELGANANGEGALIMSGGKIENLLLELIALDLQEAAGQWLTGDDSKVDVLCLAMPTKIESGRFTAQPWILDTTDALVTISGFVDLGSETIDVELEPHPKDFSLFNYLTSIEIKGNLVSREVTTNPLEAAGKVALKALAAPIMPLFSGTIEEESEAQSVPCDSLRKHLEAVMADDNPDVEQAVQDAKTGDPVNQAAPAETAAGPADKAGVSRLQEALNAKGFSLQVDGIMGPATEKALRAFQEREDLDPSGQPNAKTLRRLGIAADGR